MTIINPPSETHTSKNKQSINNNVQMIKRTRASFLFDIIPWVTGPNREKRGEGHGYNCKHSIVSHLVLLINRILWSDQT